MSITNYTYEIDSEILDILETKNCGNCKFSKSDKMMLTCQRFPEDSKIFINGYMVCAFFKKKEKN
jgi:hypothetical protein